MADDKPSGAWGSSFVVLALAAVSAVYVAWNRPLWSVPARPIGSMTYTTSRAPPRMWTQGCGRIPLPPSCGRRKSAPIPRVATRSRIISFLRGRRSLLAQLYPALRTRRPPRHAAACATRFWLRFIPRAICRATRNTSDICASMIHRQYSNSPCQRSRSPMPALQQTASWQDRPARVQNRLVKQIMYCRPPRAAE